MHLFLTIPAYQTDRPALFSALGISEARLTGLLLQLESLGLIEFKNQRHQAIDFNFHLAPESAAYRPYRSLQRLKSLEKIDRLPADATCYAMTAAFAADSATFDAFRTKILALIKQSQKTVLAAEAVHVYQLSIDFFQWDQ